MSQTPIRMTLRQLPLFLLLALCACSSPGKLIDTDYRLDYGQMQTDVRFTSGSVTRTGPGFRETNAARIRTLGDERYFVQWKEQNQTFVTLLLDLAKMNVYASIQPADPERDPLFLAGNVSNR